MNEINPNYPYIALIVIEAGEHHDDYKRQNFSIAGLNDCRITTEIFPAGSGYKSEKCKASYILGRQWATSKYLVQVIVEMANEDDFNALDTIMSLQLGLDTTKHSTKGSTALGFLNCILKKPDLVFNFGDVSDAQIHVEVDYKENTLDQNWVDNHKQSFLEEDAKNNF